MTNVANVMGNMLFRLGVILPPGVLFVGVSPEGYVRASVVPLVVGLAFSLLCCVIYVRAFFLARVSYRLLGSLRVTFLDRFCYVLRWKVSRGLVVSRGLLWGLL